MDSYYYPVKLKVIYRDPTEEIRTLLEDQPQPPNASLYGILRRKLETLCSVNIFGIYASPLLPLWFVCFRPFRANFNCSPSPNESALESNGNTLRYYWLLEYYLDVLRCSLKFSVSVSLQVDIFLVHTCCDVQQVSGLPSVKYFLPTLLSSVELTLRTNR